MIKFYLSYCLAQSSNFYRNCADKKTCKFAQERWDFFFQKGKQVKILAVANNVFFFFFSKMVALNLKAELDQKIIKRN